MEININSVGQFGIIKDVPAHELPLNAWSDGLNVRFANGSARKMLGHQLVYDPPTVAPYWLMPVQGDVNYFWLYAGLGKVYAVTGGTHSNITRAVGGDYGATAENVWTGGVLHNIGVVNNFVDDPQVWNPVSASQLLVVLPNWPANTKARALRPFKNFLIALDVVKSSVRYPQMVKWSDAATPGLAPSTWDPADATKRAGEYSLAETGDFVIDCHPLRDTNIIYKENSTWGMQLIGGIPVFRFYPIFGEAGILSRNCAVEFFNGQHAVFGSDDIFRHDGQSAVSLLTDRLRAWVYNRIDGTKYQRCFVALNFGQREVLFCYPTNGSEQCVEAVVWNFEKNTTSIRELPGVSHMALGIVDTTTASSTWNTDTETWSQDTTTWGDVTFNPTKRGLIMAVPGTTKLFESNKTTRFNGVDYEARLERLGIGIPNFDTDKPPDITSRKLGTRIWPRVTGTAGGILKVTMGGQERPDAAIVWGTEKDFVIGTTKPVDTMFNAPLLAVRFRSNTDIDWQLDGYTIDVTRGGKY